jgi:DNA polymerase III delta subunit
MGTDNAFQISKQLNIPIWLLKKQMEILTKDSGKQIDNLLNSLSQMELDIKNNTINPYNNFILLLLSNNA